MALPDPDGRRSPDGGGGVGDRRVGGDDGGGEDTEQHPHDDPDPDAGAGTESGSVPGPGPATRFDAVPLAGPGTESGDLPDPGVWTLRLTCEEEGWSFQENDQVPAWTPQGWLSFPIDRTVPRRTPNQSEAHLVGELCVPAPKDSTWPLAFVESVVETVDREARKSQQLIADSGAVGLAAVLWRAGKGAARLASKALESQPADARFVEIDLWITIGQTGRPARGRLRLKPFPLGRVTAAVRQNSRSARPDGRVAEP